jgi:hypothetical protein
MWMVVVVSKDVSTEEVTSLTETSTDISTSSVEGLGMTPAHIVIVDRNLVAPVLTEVIIIVADIVAVVTSVVADFAKVVAELHSISVESIHLA